MKITEKETKDLIKAIQKVDNVIKMLESIGLLLEGDNEGPDDPKTIGGELYSSMTLISNVLYDSYGITDGDTKEEFDILLLRKENPSDIYKKLCQAAN